jgi:long-chain acyl-CoA synthetase
VTGVLVHHFLEGSAERRPDKTALVCEGRRLTYAALDALADGLAGRLRAAGVARGDRVAIFLENSVELVVALFAALKAGGVFVVVNPTTKPDKVAYIVGNCRAAAVVTDDRRRAALADRLAALPHRPVLVSPRAEPAAPPPRPSTPTWPR